MISTIHIHKSIVLIYIALSGSFSLAGQSIAKSNPIHSSFASMSTPEETRSLSIGDKVPNIVFELLNYKNKTARLSDFKGKLIILDFWATWCTSCIYNFHKLDSLQKQFPSELQIILVNAKSTGDDEKKIKTFFQKRKNINGKDYQLITAINDSKADTLFPHKTIPHYVWIDADRNLIAITASYEINGQNIKDVLAGKKKRLRMKNDNDFDRDKPLFQDGNGGNGESIKYRSMISGYLDEASQSITYDADSNKMFSRYCMTNCTIIQLYRQVFQKPVYMNRVVLDVNDPSKFIDDGQSDWSYNNKYCYELIVPPTSEEDLYQRMQSDLVNFFGVTAESVKRKVKCLVLIQKNNPVQSNTIDRESQASRDISSFISQMNLSLQLPVVDETNFSGKVDIDLPPDIKNISLLKAAFNKCGFDLVEQERELEMFVLSEKRNKN